MQEFLPELNWQIFAFCEKKIIVVKFNFRSQWREYIFHLRLIGYG